MKTWIVSVSTVVLAATSSAIAGGPTALQVEMNNSEQRNHGEIYLEKNSVPNQRPGTISQYLDDLTESTRRTTVDANGPVRQLEARNNHKYEPLNPIVLFRW